MFATTLPFIGFEFYAWLAIVPLLILIKSSDSYFSITFESLLFLFVYNLISFSWLLGLHPLTWHGFSMDQSIAITGAAWILPAVFHSVVLIPFVFITKVFYQFRADHRSNELDLIDMIILAFIWVAIEHKFLTNLGPDLGIFSVPINLLVYSQYQNKVLIQIANAVGAVGLEYFIIMINLFLSNFFNIQKLSNLKSASSFSASRNNLNIKKPFFGIQNPTENLKYSIIFVILTLFILIYGIFQITANKKLIANNREKLKTFAVVQADYSTAATRSKNKNINQLIAVQYELSQKVKGVKNLLIWSEGSVPVLNLDLYMETVFKDLSNLTDVFIYGTYTEKDEKIYNSIETVEFRIVQENISKIGPKAIKQDESTYINFDQGETLNFSNDEYGNSENYDLDLRHHSARELEEILIYEYHKRNLVPFGEYTPIIDYLPLELKQLAESTVGSGFARETDNQDPIKTLGLNIAYSICFELLFPDLIRDQIAKDAEVIINLNDLSWFKSFLKGNLLKKQFLAVAVFRAVENKKDLILAGNCGFSALIDSTGKVQMISRPNKIAILQGYFMPRKEKSTFSLYGW